MKHKLPDPKQFHWNQQKEDFSLQQFFENYICAWPHYLHSAIYPSQCSAKWAKPDLWGWRLKIYQEKPLPLTASAVWHMFCKQKYPGRAGNSAPSLCTAPYAEEAAWHPPGNLPKGKNKPTWWVRYQFTIISIYGLLTRLRMSLCVLNAPLQQMPDNSNL